MLHPAPERVLGANHISHHDIWHLFGKRRGDVITHRLATPSWFQSVPSMDAMWPMTSDRVIVPSISEITTCPPNIIYIKDRFGPTPSAWTPFAIWYGACMEEHDREVKPPHTKDTWHEKRHITSPSNRGVIPMHPVYIWEGTLPIKGEQWVTPSNRTRGFTGAKGLVPRRCTPISESSTRRLHCPAFWSSQ